MIQKPSEAGAALFAVLAMVLLLAGFATLGLQRLRAATDRAVDGEARAEANLLANSGIAVAQSLISRTKALSNRQQAALEKPISVPLGGGTVSLRFSDAGACFNLNSLGSAKPGVKPQGSWNDLARLLVASGIPQLDADGLARATAASISSRNLLLADASEWLSVPGVTAAHFAAAGQVLCALPNREVSAFNINSVTPEKLPLLVALGLTPDEARRALASRPADGWVSANDFWQQSRPEGVPDTQAASVVGTSSRWIRLRLVAATPRAAVGRDLMLDTIENPARIASSVWLAVPQAATAA